MEISHEPEEETRVLVSSSGVESPVIVLRVDGGRFRIMDLMGFSLWVIQGGLDLDDPEEEAEWEDAGFGWLLEVDELLDGRLFVHRVGPDPSVDLVDALVVPPGVADDSGFRRLMDTVASLGGGWEIVAGGILSAFLPRRAAEAEELDLDRAIRRVLSELGETGSLLRAETPEIMGVLSPTQPPPEPATAVRMEQVRVPLTRGVRGSVTRGFVLHIPHASDRIPDDVRRGLAVSDDQLERELARLTDWFTDDLFAGLVPGATEVIYGLSRLVADPERFEDDTREPMAALGFGAVYTRTSDGRDLRPGMRAEAREDLLQRFYRPHHHRLERAVRAVLESEDRCLLIDCHSFPRASVPFEGSQNRPEICIGTDSFHTPSHLRDALVSAFHEEGFTVLVDDPFAGALVPQAYFRRTRRVEVIMLEVGRWIYMDEVTLRKRADFSHVRERIGRAMHAALEEL